MSTQQLAGDPAVQPGLTLLKQLFQLEEPADFAVRFWDGSTWGPETGAAFTIVLQHPGSLRRMFWPPSDLRVGEAYIYDDFDIEGDVQAYLTFMRRLSVVRRGLLEKVSLARRLYRLPVVERPRQGRGAAKLTGKQRSIERDRKAIAYHYDTSNDFFATFLDPDLVYTCAYFETPGDSLEKAQKQKLDLVCRKLRLQPGQRLLDVGCGWGQLLIHAAQEYGVEAVGITTSRQQLAWVDAKIRRLGLENRCRVEFRDFRQLDGSEKFDKVATLEVLEHAGAGMLPEYLKAVDRALVPGGAVLIQNITLNGTRGVVRWRQFAMNYIFPDGELWPASALIRDAELAGFEVRDVESLREHYILTLAHWLGNLEGHHDAAVRTTDEATYRSFRLYLAGARLGFITNAYNVYEFLLIKPDEGKSGLPLQRTDWYGV